MVLLLVAQLACSQSVAYDRVLDLPDLEGAEFYQLMQDDIGFLWATTDMGVVRFDGSNTVLFTTKDGLAENTIFKMDQDGDGRIWFLGFKEELSFYEKGKFGVLKLHPRESWRSSYARFISDIKTDKKGRVWVANERAVYSFDKSGAGFTEKLNGENEVHIVPVKDGDLFINLCWPNPEKDRKIHRVFVGKHRFDLDIDVSKFKDYYNAVSYKDQSVILSYNQKVFFLDTMQGAIFSHEFPFDINSIFVDDQKNIWIGAMESGLFMFEDGDLSRPSIHILSDETITDIIQDNQGSIWVSTLSSGVHHINSTATRKISMPVSQEKELHVSCVSGNEKGVFFGTNTGNLFLLNRESGEVEDLHAQKYFSRIRDIDWHGKELVAYAQSSEFDFVNLPHMAVYKGIAKRNDLIVRPYSVHPIQGPRPVPNPMAQNRIECAASMGDTFLLGTTNGPFLFIKGELTFIGDKFPALGDRIMDIAEWKEGVFLLATKDQGVFAFDFEKVWRPIDEGRLRSSFYKHIFIDKQRSVWLSSPKGIECIRGLDAGGESIQVSHFDKSNGLASNNVYQCYAEGTTVYAATKSGLFVLDTKKVNRYEMPIPVHLLSVQLGIKDTVLTKNAEIPFRYRDITFAYESIGFKERDEIQYQYRLWGADTQWGDTKETSIRFSNLSFGSYTFDVRAKNTYGQWGPGQRLASFILLPHFSETIWFRLVMVFSVALLVLLGTVLVVRFYRTKTQLEHDANRFQHQPL